ncbi:NAD(P)/FAD-dependent oxidoreductase [Aliikangiella coralliicola]|uniref:FAD-binding protein n=1 Tax=Aliikangiella coralliicola TaxID=2592383 RepID=A0A545U5X2_9GAMM|nr:FAD-dependent oxidoreductase [Aliikangiella coralliicola]TQV84861.1 FAD-binding protein [Aliikangiella coralliicola]
MQKQTDVLIIGGGFGGVGAAQKLSKNGVSVTLVDRKNYFEVTFATLRDVTDPGRLGNSPRKLYSDFIDGTFIQGSIESMNDKEAKLTNGLSIRFKQAIIASGSRYPSLPLAKSNSAFDYSERNQEIMNEHKSIASAKSILVIGGGAVGVEFAGEIASAFPDKDITLAHSTDTLLDNMKPKVQRKALEQLTAKGVNVKFNRRFTKDGNVYRCSKSQESLQVDIAYACVGMLPNTEFLKAELPGILDDKGFVKVDSLMKVQGYENLYALGDCATLDNHKHGYVASVQGAMLADALLRSAKGKKIKPYKTPPFAVITPTGTDSGVAQMPFGVTTAKFFVNLKQKDLGISNMYKIYGSKPDKLN